MTEPQWYFPKAERKRKGTALGMTVILGTIIGTLMKWAMGQTPQPRTTCYMIHFEIPDPTPPRAFPRLDAVLGGPWDLAVDAPSRSPSRTSNPSQNCVQRRYSSLERKESLVWERLNNAYRSAPNAPLPLDLAQALNRLEAMISREPKDPRLENQIIEDLANELQHIFFLNPQEQADPELRLASRHIVKGLLKRARGAGS